MSVYTSLTTEQQACVLQQYALEDYTVTPLSGGTQNSNYLLTAGDKRLVQTILEQDSEQDAVIIANLVAYLAERGLAVNKVVKNRAGELTILVDNKPVMITHFLAGEHYEVFTEKQVQALATWLADFHLLGMDYEFKRPNKRTRAFWQQQYHTLRSHLKSEEAVLLEIEVAFQLEQDFSQLPQGVIHSDIFRDNVLFVGEQLSGVIDFYDSCFDSLLLDVAVTINDCCQQENGQLSTKLVTVFLECYQQRRAFTQQESQCWPAMQRLAALTFWLERLTRFYFPPAGSDVLLKDPSVYQYLLADLQQR